MEGPKRNNLDRASDEALNTRARGYDITKGTHGGVMPDSGVIPSHITPPNERPGERQAFPGLADPNRAYYSAAASSPRARFNSNWQGWNWATSAARKQGFDTEVRGRAVMHNVEAEGTIDTDKNMNTTGTQGTELTADRLRVTGTEWIRPPTSSEAGVQGTLPHINWNQHVGHTGLARNEDYNNVGISAHTGEMGLTHRNDRAEEEAMDAQVHERRLKRLHAEEPRLPGLEH
jgi:hypothetical protein